MNGFHSNSKSRRLEAAKELHRKLFHQYPAEYKVIMRDEGETSDLFESVNITFQGDQVVLPNGYFLEDAK